MQRLSLIYEQGTQNIKTTGRTRGSGVGLGRGGIGVGFGSATTTIKGTSQSIAAKNAAPPPKKSYKLTLGLVLVAIVCFVMDWTMAGVALLAGCGFFLWQSIQYNRNTYPQLYADWQKSWLCNKCGSIYVQ